MLQVLTDSLCKSKPPQHGRLEHADLRQSGLELRITATGVRSFGFRFRDPQTRRTLRATIGNYPALSLEAARRRAHEMAAQVATGINPIEVRATEREQAHTRTFGALAERYLKEHAYRHKRPRSAEEDRRNLAVHVLPKWAKRDYRAITRADIVTLIEGVIASGKPTAANRVHSLISGVFSFGLDAGLIAANPASRLKKRGVERQRKTVLAISDVKAFWHGCVKSPCSESTGLALRLALLSAARVSEIAGARKDEFDLDKKTWTLVGDRTKNHQEHLIPLAPLAVVTIKAAMALSGDSPYLFPSRRPGRHINRHSLGLAMHRLTGGWRSPVGPHDLRRTVNTWFAANGVSREVREAVLGHINGRRAPESHYNVHEFEPEKRAALTRWAKQIDRLTR
jgi:integrase